MAKNLIIIGAGHAGGMVAGNLRQAGFDGAITLLGAEPLPPYQRPPLSKAWLKGEADADGLTLRPREFYTESKIDLRTGVTVKAIDRAAKQVVLENGERLAYDILIIATGAQPIRLPIPGADLQGVLALRTAHDAEMLKHAIAPGRRVAVIGGGYIGLEVAASTLALGGAAVVLERAPRLLARSASVQIAEFFQRYHEARGVKVRTDVEVVGFEGKDGHVSGVRLANGEIEPCDIALVGVGIRPDIALAQAAGLDCDRGVIVDDNALTSDPAIYAIGDCTRRPSALYGQMVCPESVPSALEQAKQAANHITGQPAPVAETPWNWSDQYDLKLQVAGFPFDVDNVVVRGDPAKASFAVFHLMGDKVRQVEAINAAPEFMAGRLLIGKQTPVDRAKLADTSVHMKAVAAS